MRKWKQKVKNENENKRLEVGNETKSKLKTTKIINKKKHKRS